MSFSCGVGDCIAILQIASKVRERFDDAPEQFKAFSNEVTNISSVLRNTERVLSQQALTDWQKKPLSSILQESHNVIIAMGKVADENYHLNPSNVHSFRDKSRRAWKILNWDRDDIQELRSRAALNVNLLNAFNESLMSKVTLETRDEVQRLHKRHDRRERHEEDQAILDWLTPINYSLKQHDFISRRQAGTGQWLLDSVEFQAWLAGDKPTLFCPGIPGAGKTILTSIIIENLCTRFQTDSSIGIAYIYCNFKRSHEQKLEDLLLSLLKQLAQGRLSIPDTVRSLYNQHKRWSTRPSIDNISEVLRSVVSSFSKAFIITDALDECQVNDRCRPSFISEIFNLQTKSGANLFATSRFIPEITDQFTSGAWLEIRASDDDIKRYLDGNMAKLPRCVSRSPDLQEKIKDAIVKTADGMFLLAHLHLVSLEGAATPKAIRRALEKLPKGPDALDLSYEEATQRIQGQEPGHVALARRVLWWITCAMRPLTGIELLHALAIEAGDSELGEDNLQDLDEIISRCAGLVTIDEESNIIRLVHYTTQEYFEKRQTPLFPDAQEDIAVTCITYLLFNTFETGLCLTDDEFDARTRLHPLYDYAAKNWGYHARAAWAKVKQLTFKLLESEQKALASTQAMIASKSSPNYRERVPEQMTGVHLAVYFELDEAISALLKKGYQLDSKDSFGQTPLSWAAENGHEAIVKLLLKNGAELDSEDNYKQTPLLWATRNGYETVVRLLLEEGAELGPMLLFWAARKGHDAVVRLLIEKGAGLELQENNSQAPLSWAARNGHEAVVRLLLEKGAKIESKDNYSRTPLSWAAENGHEAVVRLLLEKSSKLESKDTDGRTPLLWAARKGHTAVVRLLLERGANLESKDNDGRTPLLWAVRKRHEAVKKLLLENGAETTSAAS